jgi:tetratricopeptide (TPR) repeat protein
LRGVISASMAERRKKEVHETAKIYHINTILTGLLCLVIGIGIGYFWGRQSTDSGPSFSSSQTQAPPPTQGSIQNLQAFNENEIALKAQLAADPKNLNALIQLGNLYYDHGKFREAVEWYGKALEIDPRNPNVRTDRGTSYWNMKQPDAALEEFRKSLEVDPSHAQTLYNMGVVYLYGKNDPESARKAWRSLLDSNPNYPDRAKVEEQLTSLPAPAQNATSPAGKKDSASPRIEDLLERLKSNP